MARSKITKTKSAAYNQTAAPITHDEIEDMMAFAMARRTEQGNAVQIVVPATADSKEQTLVHFLRNATDRDETIARAKRLGYGTKVISSK